MRTRVVLWVVVAAALGGRVLAQQPPDLSGGWAAVKDAPVGVAAAPSPVFGARFWLRQQGSELTVTRPVRDTAVVAVHSIGGADVTSRVPGAMCLGDSSVITNVVWDGASLVHRLVASIPAGATAPVPSGLRHTIRRHDADTLIVESTMRVAGQADPVAVGTTYRRMSDPPPAVAVVAGPVVAARLDRLAWLSGAWAGVVGSGTVEERWTPASGGTMLATSRTVRGSAVAEFEFLCIAERQGSLVYTAMPNGRTPATDFMLTSLDETSATFENPANQFPKAIRYAIRADGTLEATISGAANQRSTTFTFKKSIERSMDR